jgi:gliding motility-associated-like protein
MPKQRILFLFLVFVVGFLNAQVSNDCSSAVPICANTPINGGAAGFGVDDFNGETTSGCLEATTTGVIESNSSWYRFRTNATGELGFNISHDASEDWDFALYLASDCSSLGEPVRCNFFDNSDENQFIGVGEDPSGDTESLQYEICYNDCPDICNSADIALTIGENVSCFVGNVITPNNDGYNDALIAPCLQNNNFPSNSILIFNQYGDEVFSASPYDNNWAGTANGKALPASTYFYILDLGNGSKPLQGYIVLEL